MAYSIRQKWFICTSFASICLKDLYIAIPHYGLYIYADGYMDFMRPEQFSVCEYTFFKI